MSFDKAIKYGKTKRKPYTGGKAVAGSCRNHGWCTFCQGNRLYNSIKKMQASSEAIKDALTEKEAENDETARRGQKGLGALRRR